MCKTREKKNHLSYNCTSISVSPIHHYIRNIKKGFVDKVVLMMSKSLFSFLLFFLEGVQGKKIIPLTDVSRKMKCLLSYLQWTNRSLLKTENGFMLTKSIPDLFAFPFSQKERELYTTVIWHFFVLDVLKFPDPIKNKYPKFVRLWNATSFNVAHLVNFNSKHQ